jgi:hypothetical protein
MYRFRGIATINSLCRRSHITNFIHLRLFDVMPRYRNTATNALIRYRATIRSWIKTLVPILAAAGKCVAMHVIHNMKGIVTPHSLYLWVHIQNVDLQNVESQNVELQNVDLQNVDKTKRRNYKTSTVTKGRHYKTSTWSKLKF